MDKTLSGVELSLEEVHVNLVEMQQMTAEVFASTAFKSDMISS